MCASGLHSCEDVDYLSKHGAGFKVKSKSGDMYEAGLHAVFSKGIIQYALFPFICSIHPCLIDFLN